MATRKIQAFNSLRELGAVNQIAVSQPVIPRRGALPVLAAGLMALLAPLARPAACQEPDRPRARDLGIAVGIFEPGRHNAITDVEGVLVGHTTVIEGDDIRTGVTAIRPHGGNLYYERVPAAMHVGNGFGKLLGVTQVGELGELEMPILLTCTLCVWRAADAMVEWALEMEGMERVRSINPVVGETNDGGLNDIRSRPVTDAHVRAALEGAAGGRWRRGRSGPERERRRSAGRAGSGPVPGCCPRRWGATRSGCWSSPTSGASCGSPGRRLGGSWGGTRSGGRWSGGVGGRGAGAEAGGRVGRPEGGGMAGAGLVGAVGRADPATARSATASPRARS